MSGKPIAIAVLAVSPLLGQQVDIRTLGASVLQHTEVAGQALANHDTRTALEEVRQALAATDQINAASPAAEEPLRVPLASDFDAISTMVPAKRHGSAGRLKHNSSVSEVNGTYTVTALNVSSARAYLLAAQTALRSGDLDAASTDLASVKGDVVTSSFTGAMPLVQAKDNLNLATARVKDGKFKDAILPLKSASRALQSFAHQEPQPRHADLAAKIALDMDAYADRIEKDHQDASGRIAGWLDQVTAWFYSGMPL
jgi:hypothetical protein